MNTRLFFVTAAAVVCSGLAGAQTHEASVAAGDPALGDGFGRAVAVSVDTAVVGADLKAGGQGAAYVYRRNAGVWSQEAKLAPPGSGQQAGQSVDVAGNRALLGAPQPFNPFAPGGAGTVHVYDRTGVVWALSQSLSTADGQANDQFGQAVALGVGRLAGGAVGDEGAGPGSRFGGRGAVYVFRQQGTWVQEQKLVPADAVSGDRAGAAVDLTDDLCLAGAPGKASAAGAAYVFRRSGNTWSQEAKLTAADAAAEDGFGTAAALTGTVALLGAPGDDGAGADAGAAYVFRFNGTAWVQEAKLVAGDASPGDQFGVSVSAANGRVLIGAAGGEAAYLFTDTGSGWVQTAKLGNAAAIGLGTAVGLSLDFAVVGSPLTGFTGSADLWCINPGPVLLSVNPTSGIFNQSTPVTLSGANFSAVKPKTVTFGGNLAGNVNVVSDSQISCDAPPGVNGQSVDVVVTQDGLSSTLVSGFSYVGTDVTAVAPVSGPPAGGNVVTISGSAFVNNGSTVVTFGGAMASIQSITPPGTIVVLAPAGVRGSSVDVTVTSSNGSDTLVGGYTYQKLNILGVDVASGNLLGGQTLTVSVDLGTNIADTTLILGGVPMTLTSANSSSIVFTTPGVPEASSAALDIAVSNSNGSDTLAGAFTYSPSLAIGVTGTTVAGGSLAISWVTDQAVVGPQFITLWVGNPLQPPLGAHVGGYAGLVQYAPLLFLLNGAPASIGAINLNFGPLPAGIAGFPLHMQALVTGEGAPLGSFTNGALFVIP